MADTLEDVMAGYARAADSMLDKLLDEGEHEGLKEAMRWIPMAGGKRLRPVLTAMVGEAVNGKYGAKVAMVPGVALEVIHNFTLVHDDIMDRSELRRNRVTVHKKWDEATAINAGDALFARAFEILELSDVRLDIQLAVYGKVAHMVRRIAEGQQFDMDFEKAPTVTKDQYLHMIQLKTAMMFSTGAWVGARVAGGSPTLALELEDYGEALGIAFQIQDDLLDLGALEADLGKPIGKDLRNGKRTLMVIDALDTLEGAKLKAFKRVLGKATATDAEVDKAVSLLDGCGSLGRARATAAHFGDEAREGLAHVRRGKARDRLEELIGYVTSRAK